MEYWMLPAKMYNSISSLRHFGAWFEMPRVGDSIPPPASKSHGS
jgi:hypothetical protein